MLTNSGIYRLLFDQLMPVVLPEPEHVEGQQPQLLVGPDITSQEAADARLNTVVDFEMDI